MCGHSRWQSRWAQPSYQIRGWTPENQNLFIKKLCIYSYKFKLYSPSFTFHLIHLSFFFHFSKQFLNLLILTPFSASAVFFFFFFLFVSPFPHGQNISLWGLFSPGETKKNKVAWGEIGWIGRVGPGGQAIFRQNCWTLSVVWAGVLVNHPSRNGQMQIFWESSKNSLKLNNVSWYTDTDEFLEPCRGSLYYKGLTLQKIIPVYFVYPSNVSEETTRWFQPPEIGGFSRRSTCN